MTGLTMTSPKFAALFGHPVRQAETENLTQFHMDIAASIQAVTEEIVLRITKSLSNQYETENLCLAGGVGAGSGAGAGAGADLEEVYADTGALRSVLTGLSKSSRRPPLKRSKSSPGDGPVWTTAVAAEGHSPGWLAAWAACWYGTAL